MPLCGMMSGVPTLVVSNCDEKVFVATAGMINAVAPAATAAAASRFTPLAI